MRIKFAKGKQRRFFQDVLRNANCPSLRELKERGFDVSYSTLKNYFSERRLIPENLFDELIEFGGLSKKEFDFEKVDEHWGQVKGGKKRRGRS